MLVVINSGKYQGRTGRTVRGYDADRVVVQLPGIGPRAILRTRLDYV